MDVTPGQPQRPTKDSADRLRRFRRWDSGLAQLTLVEHALCPLDDTRSLVDFLCHQTGYFYTDQHGHSKFAKVTVNAPSGLSAKDEFFLWGLLALTFQQPEPSTDFYATPHYCLRQLGCLESARQRGGTKYERFRESIKRLAEVIYKSEHFYDPIRQEYRDCGFGFLKYSLPIDPESSRAWRIVWDQQFFELCQATGGRLFFDLKTYRDLDYASRRLFLVLHKMFWRSDRSPLFDVRHLAVNVMGFAPSVDVRDLKLKLIRSIKRLLSRGIIRLLPGMTDPVELIQKRATGSYTIRLYRGPHFQAEGKRRTTQGPPALSDSPLHEPLRAIGFGDARIRSILKKYKHHLVEQWADVTLAKLERLGRDSFTNCPEAFFIHNIKAASQGKRTPPDWYLEIKKEEERRHREAERAEGDAKLERYEPAWMKARGEAWKKYLDEQVGREAFEQAVKTLVEVFQKTLPRPQALDRAIHEAERHFASSFDFPELAAWVYEHAQDPTETTLN